MNNRILHKNIISALSLKFPKKPELTEALVNMLQLEKEAVYRRLRGDVPFSFGEVIIIAKNLEISIDDIILSDPAKSFPFHLKLTEYVDPTDSDYMMLNNMIKILASLKSGSESRGVEATNILPQPVYHAYENLTRFHLFKWKYSYESIKNGVIPYGEIVISENFRKLFTENVRLAKYIHTTDYILDNSIFRYIVNDLKYFSLIRLLTNEDVLGIKQDLLAVVDDLERLAKTGRFAETGNKINLYISGTNFQSSYFYIETPDFNITMVKAFILYTIASVDNNIFEKIKHWIDSLMQQSTSITQSGERERILFFEKQREIINQL